MNHTKYNHIHVIINPTAGDDKPDFAQIERILTSYGAEYHIDVSDAPGDGAKSARAAIEANSDLVVVYGGDGTVGDVATGLIDSDTPLGILPGGTGNAIALDLNMPDTIEQSLETILHHARPRSLDLGKITCGDDTSYFLLRSSIGLYNEMLSATTPELKEQFGSLAYLLGALSSLQESATITFDLTIDGQSIRVDGHSCIVANTAAIGGLMSFDFAPGVNPMDGMLDVFVFNAETLDFLQAIRSNIATDLSTFPNHWQARSVKIAIPDEQPVYRDGIPFCQSSVEIQSVPHSLRVMVPLESQREEDE